MHSAFLIQKELMPRRVLAASLIASRQASSKLFGDCAITSILRTIDIALSSRGKRPPTRTAVVGETSRSIPVLATVPLSTAVAGLGCKHRSGITLDVGRIAQ